MREAIDRKEAAWVHPSLIVMAGRVRAAKHGLLGTVVPDCDAAGQRPGPRGCVGLLLFGVRSRPWGSSLGANGAGITYGEDSWWLSG